MRWLVVALSVLAVAALVFVLVVSQRPSLPVPQPTPTATPTDPYAWVKSLPDASTMPACPPALPPELRKYYYRHCPS